LPYRDRHETVFERHVTPEDHGRRQFRFRGSP